MPLMFSRNRRSTASKRRGSGYRRKFQLESLEDRRVLALVGVAPVDLPTIGYNSGGTVSYNALLDAYSISATPLSITTDSATGIFFSGDLDFNIRVDGAGSLVGGVIGDDLVLTGEVDLDGDFVVDYSGTLLTGEILAFGHEDSGGSTDLYDFRFEITGGQLTHLYAGKDLGVTTSSENSSFTGDFSVNFGGNAKGDIGAIDPQEQPSIDLEKFVKIIRPGQPGGLEGLTPGFWKTHSEYGPAPSKGWAATGYDPDDSYESIFGVNVASGDVTLLQALGSNGGGVNALMRHSAAALLNAANPNINYAYSESQVISMTNAAINSGYASQIEQLKNEFDFQNNKGADLSDGGSGSGTIMFGPDDADSAPGLMAQIGDQVMYLYTVANTGDAALAIDSLIDDNATPGHAGDDFTPAAVDDDFNGFNDGDVNTNGVVDPGEVWLFQTGLSTITTTGEFCNTAVVIASSVNTNAQVTDEDAACYTVPGPPLPPPTATVQIDVKPGSDPNAINLAKGGLMSIAIFSTSTFDARRVDVGTVQFAGASVVKHSLQDVNGDGRLDMVLHFSIQDTMLLDLYKQALVDADQTINGKLDSSVSSRQTATVGLTGQTVDDVMFEGFDDVDMMLNGKDFKNVINELALAGMI
jgi:hypothetical protein